MVVCGTCGTNEEVFKWKSHNVKISKLTLLFSKIRTYQNILN